jgi:hypothetical protein
MIKPLKNKLIEVPHFTDDRGTLSVVEDILPFTVERVYWITNTHGKIRGGHAHKVTRQALISLGGSSIINIKNDHTSTKILLDSPTKMLLLEPEDWHTMQIEQYATLLVLASHKYDIQDYVYE